MAAGLAAGAAAPRLRNFVGGEWRDAPALGELAIVNPATRATLALLPLSGASAVEEAVARAAAAFPGWAGTPVTDRIAPLFRFRELLLARMERLARLITDESGKTLDEARAELKRGIENVEVACGAPMLMQGVGNADIARGIDEHMVREPLGVVAAICPFNFPAMIPLWFLPYALACGNCMILKPSERAPMTGAELVAMLHESGIPPGVIQLVHGGREAVEALADHPRVAAVSLVGSTGAAQAVYARASAAGKRAQCQGGAKNAVVVMPDADLEMSTRIVADSAFGCAGQRCLAASLVITVGDAARRFDESICAAARARAVGYGAEPGVEMGALISHQSRERALGMIEAGMREGATLAVDGRGGSVEAHPRGSFLHPTILAEVPPAGEIATTEVFAPVLGIMRARDLDQAIQLINGGDYGNMACIFTADGATARKFRHEAVAGNIGINVGVAAPMAFFPFSGWKRSFFGDLHAQGRHGIEFYTQTKVVIERWPKHWSRAF